MGIFKTCARISKINSVVYIANSESPDQTAPEGAVWSGLSLVDMKAPPFYMTLRERSDSVVECLTQDRRAVGLSLTCVTVLWFLSKTQLS